jgi:hypothetical protein
LWASIASGNVKLVWWASMRSGNVRLYLF